MHHAVTIDLFPVVPVVLLVTALARRRTAGPTDEQRMAALVLHGQLTGLGVTTVVVVWLVLGTLWPLIALPLLAGCLAIHATAYGHPLAR